MASLSINDHCFDVLNVGHSCKELVRKYCDIEVVMTAVIMVWSMEKRVGSIFCSRVGFNYDVVVS